MKLFRALLLLPILLSCQKNEEIPVIPAADTTVCAADTAFFYEQCIYRPGDYESTNWRIPAICTLPDGTLLIVNDKRKHNEGDLPEDIDIVSRRSTDNGRTWSEPVNIAVGTGYKHGFGDPALVVAENGDVICVFVGGNGLWASSAADPIRSYVCRSTDGGITWSEPQEITEQIWGIHTVNSSTRRYKASFFGSGNGLRLMRGEHKGRILFAAAMRPTGDAYVLNNFVVYSDDNGATWNVSECAFTGGDEAKLMELVDGRVLISVRRSGERGFNISNDGGVTWGTQGTWPEMTTNACNGDMLRFSAVDQGGEKNILLHSIPNSMNRENVSLFVSFDEGVSWQNPVTLFAGPSVYSSLTLLKDGTIGAYVEKNPDGACELWYMNFSYKWLEEQRKKIESLSN